MRLPSIKFHISRSISPPDKARQIHEALDMPSGLPYFDINLHMKWRQLTHSPLIAAYLGFLFNGEDGAIDAIQHLRDDFIYNRIFYSRRSNKDNGEETEEDM